MKRWPQSLFWRSALMITGLLLLSQIVLSIAFYVFVQRPRIDFMQDLALTYIDNIRSALATLPAAERDRFLHSGDVNADLRITREQPAQIASGTAELPVVRLFIRELQEKLPNGERIIVQQTPVQALWVSLLVNGESYWVVVQLAKLRVDTAAAWQLPLMISFALAAIGGVLIHQSINRPLLQLQSFAQAMGRGDRPPPLASHGAREIATVSAAFNRMAQDIDSIESDRRLMLAGVSHDLRTPVTRLRLALEVEGENIEPAARERMEANLRELDSALSQFLDFARSERDESIVNADLFDIASECVATYDAMNDSPSESTTHVIKLIGTHGTRIRARPQALMRALTNLIENSRKYSAGDIEIAVERLPTCALIVRDRGELLHSADFERLRKPFARLNESRSGAAGTGLGLAIVERIATLHDAKLTFTPRNGGGLEVRMSFPSA
jgi:two-component system, OmpR family, osmolarity sensor histidine kinase EnvZ